MTKGSMVLIKECGTAISVALDIEGVAHEDTAQLQMALGKYLVDVET